jgi:hypothetical protein
MHHSRIHQETRSIRDRGPTLAWFFGIPRPWRPKPSIRLDTDQWARVGPVWTFELERECSWFDSIVVVVVVVVTMNDQDSSCLFSLEARTMNNGTKRSKTAAKKPAVPCVPMCQNSALHNEQSGSKFQVWISQNFRRAPSGRASPNRLAVPQFKNRIESINLYNKMK